MNTFDILLGFTNEKLWLTVFIFILFIHACPKRTLFVLRCAGGIVGLIVFGLLPDLWNSLPNMPFSVPSLDQRMLIWPIILALYMGVLFRSSWNMKIFSAIAGLCAQETLFGFWALVSIWIPGIDTNLGELLVTSIGSVLMTVFLYFFLSVKITPRKLQMLRQRSLFPLVALYVLAALLVSSSLHTVLFFMLGSEQLQSAAVSPFFSVEKTRLTTVIANISGNIIVLLTLNHILRFSETDLEREMLEQIREQDRKQYDRFRSNVDYINTKSYDLKHYLDLIRNHESIPSEELEQVSDSLRHLDAETDSGNETLDLILTDRRLTCENQQIELIFQTDGTRLEQLDVIDTYTVFCNILDNAIGYVRHLPPEERSIRLGIRSIHNMVFIHQENPFVGHLEMKDGLPVTTQEDETLHGFGLKSVQSTVAKRKGELIIRAENGRFELDICFSGE